MEKIKNFKRTLLLLAATCTTAGLNAQYADLYYHRVGDTIEWCAPNGYYAWMELEHYYNNHMALQVTGWVDGPYDSAIVLQRLYTPTPLKIIGIAVGAFPPSYTADSNLLYDMLYIYDADSSNFTLKSTTRWSPLDPYRALHIKIRQIPRLSDTCCNTAEFDGCLPIYEYYFDSAFYVTDSFYVGGGIHYRWNRDHTQLFRPSYIAFATLSYIPPSLHLGICDPERQHSRSCSPINLLHKRRDAGTSYATEGPWSSWYWVEGGTQPIFNGGPGGRIATAWPLLIYPIVEVDTTVPPEGVCLPIQNVQVPLADSGCATVTWDHFPNFTQVLLQYGPVNAPESLWETVDVSGQTIHRLCGLTAPIYKVRMKGICGKNDNGWSDAVTFYNSYIPEDTTQIINGPASQLEANTFLSPNPASGTVHVSSSFSLRGIDIYNAAGLLVLHFPSFGHDEALSLEGLPAGSYIVAIHTQKGSTHKKLLIK